MRIGTVAVSLLVATALALTGNGLLSTLAALRLADSGVSEAAGGWILAAYFAGLTIGTLILPSTIERVGGVRSFTAFTALGVIASLAHGLIAPSWSWMVLRAMSGLAMAGLYMTVESWLNAEASPETRGRVMAAYLVALYLGTGLGQLLLPIWPNAGLEGFVIAALATSLAATIAALARVNAPDLHTAERISARALVRIAPLGWSGAWLSGMLAGTIYATVPLSARAAGLSATELSHLMAAYVAGGLAGQWPIGRVSDRMDRRAVLLVVAGLLSICCFATPQIEGNWVGARLAMAFIFGALAFSIYPIAVAHTLDRVGTEQALPAASQMLLGSSIGAVLGPILASAVSSRFGEDSFFVMNGVLLASFAMVATIRIVRVAPVAQDAFVPVPRTTVAVHELDARVDLEADPIVKAESSAIGFVTTKAF
jgi:MFS family permease